MEFVGIEKISLVDYDNKISCVLFTERCNFRCQFCHNSRLVLDKNNEIPFSDILTYLKKRKNVLDGVVITGGEPTLMDDLVEKIKAIKELGLLVKLDTNGTNPNLVKQLIDDKLIDYVAMDIKNSMDTYSEIIGIKNIFKDNILKTIEILKTSGISYEFRTTLVNEFHSEKSIEDMGKMLKGAKKMYLQHFIDNEECIVHNLHEVDIDTANKYKNILLKYIDNVYLRGY